MRSISIDGAGGCSPRVSGAGQHCQPCPDVAHSKLRQRSKFLMRLQILGMTSGALDAWEKSHEQTEAAIVVYCIVAVAIISLYAHLLVGAPVVGAYVYAFRLTLPVCLASQVFCFVGIWRYGQPSFDTLAFRTSSPLVTVCLICVIVVGHLCPIASVPFASALHFTAVCALLSWLMNLVVALVPFALSPEPCRRLVSVVFPALMSTVRTMDACTDFTFLRVLAVQVRAWSLHKKS